MLTLCPVNGSGDGIDLPQRVLFPPERLNLKWNQVHRIGAGLQNMGNTCFLNSALQCLTYTPPFANYMLTREHSKTCKLVFCVALFNQKSSFTIMITYIRYFINLFRSCSMCEQTSFLTQIFSSTYSCCRF